LSLTVAFAYGQFNSIANEQEHFRGGSSARQISSANVDDKTLHELYLWPFAEAVTAKSKTIDVFDFGAEFGPSTAQPNKS
jgi:hypothetical protein